jgi:hypothetical protein
VQVHEPERVADRFLEQAVFRQSAGAKSAETRAGATQQAATHAVRVARFELEMARAAVASTDRLQNGGAADVLQVRAPVLPGPCMHMVSTDDDAAACNTCVHTASECGAHCNFLHNPAHVQTLQLAAFYAVWRKR